MFNAPPPRQPKHLPILTKAINGYADHGIHNITVSPPLQMSHMCNTVSIWMPEPPGLILARSPSGGIDPISGTTMGSGEVELYDQAGDQLTLGSRTMTAYNPYDIAVPGSVKVWIFGTKITGWQCEEE